MQPHPPSRRLRLTGSVLLAVAVSSSGRRDCRAQSPERSKPAAVQQGVNRATLPSPGGSQFWRVVVLPGRFEVLLAGGGPNRPLPQTGSPTLEVSLGTQSPGASLQHQEVGGGSMVSGTVTVRTVVNISIVPARDKPAAVSIPYTLVVTGDVDFSEGEGPRPEVVGVYAVASGWQAPGGVAHLLPDGTITTTTGLHGAWTLSDAARRVYVITLGQMSRKLLFEPGRGFVDPVDHSLAMEARQ